MCVKDCVKGGMTTGGAYQEKVNNLQINAHTVTKLCRETYIQFNHISKVVCI